MYVCVRTYIYIYLCIYIYVRKDPRVHIKFFLALYGLPYMFVQSPDFVSSVPGRTIELSVGIGCFSLCLSLSPSLSLYR